MRKILAAVIAVMFVAVPSTFAQLKVGVINSEVIFARFEGTKTAQEKFNKEVAKWEQEASKRQKDLQALKDQLDKQSLLLSAERKKELMDSLQNKYASYQQFLQEKFGQKGEALSKNEELTKPIVDKITKILDKIAKDENYDLIMDARAGGVLYYKPAFDLNERVLDLLNKEK
jgi:outer membrane protein